MPRISVTPEALTALAGSLAGVADELAWCAQRAGTDAWALGPGDSAAALAEVLGDIEHQRLLLGRSCAALGAAVRAAGSAYAEVEAGIGADLAGGGEGRGSAW